MEIKKQDVEYVAKLARLYISEKQKESLTKEMGDIIKFADKLAELDTQKVELKEYEVEVKNVFREDKIMPSYSREELLKNAPDKQAGCYCVPKIVE